MEEAADSPRAAVERPRHERSQWRASRGDEDRGGAARHDGMTEPPNDWLPQALGGLGDFLGEFGTFFGARASLLLEQCCKPARHRASVTSEPEAATIGGASRMPPLQLWPTVRAESQHEDMLRRSTE